MKSYASFFNMQMSIDTIYNICYMLFIILLLCVCLVLQIWCKIFSILRERF